MKSKRKRGRPRGSDPAPSKDDILEAAVASVAEVGLQRASISHVAEKAGASKTSVLYHFRNREGLVAALALKVLSDFQEGVSTGSKLPKGDVARAEAGVRAFFKPEYRESLVVMRELMTQGAFDKRMGELVRFAVETRVQMIASLLDLPTPLALSTARNLVMAVQGAVDAWVCSGSSNPAPYCESAIETARALIESAGNRARLVAIPDDEEEEFPVDDEG